MNYAARNAARLGRLRDLEMLVVDWGSDEPMRRALALSPEAASITRFLEVEPALARAQNPQDLAIHGAKATNAAARRARGRYLAVMPADVLLPQLQLGGLFEILAGNVPTAFDPTKALLLIGAFGLPWQICEREPDLEGWDRYLQLHGRHLDYTKDYPGLASAASQLIFHRNLYTELRGLNENMPYWGWTDIEIGLRVSQRHVVVDLLPFGVFAYDMRQRPDLRKSAIRRTNPHVVNGEFAVNAADWGLAGYDLPALAAEPPRPQRAAAKPRLSEKLQRLLAVVRARLNVLPTSAAAAGAQNDPDEAALVLLTESVMTATVPRNLLDRGTRRHWPALAAASLDPTLEVLACDDWVPRPDMPLHTPDAVSMDFQKAGFTGLLHFLTGDLADMPQRLSDISMGREGFDLMVLRLALLGDRAVEIAAGFVERLAVGGIVVVSGPEEIRQAVLADLTSRQGLTHLLTLSAIEMLVRG